MRRGVFVLALLAATAAALAPRARADVMYWGGTIKGDVYGVPGEAPTSAAVLSRFEADAGKRITFVNTGQSWVSFNAATMQAAIAVGAIPLVTMPLAPGVTLGEVAEGKQDAAIRGWAQAAKAFGYPFLFRPWWEPNGDWYAWGRKPEYVRAWRHFHDVVEAVGATNVTWAWVVNAIWSDPLSDPKPYYPGAAYVDWVGMDAYNWGENPLQPARWLTAAESIQPTLEVLEETAPGKPVCICESASTEYGGGEPGEEKALWIREMLTEYLPSHPAIKAYLWFNWNAVQAGSGERFDWPIESSPGAESAFRQGIQGETFLSVLPKLAPLAKVPMPAWPPPPAEPGPALEPRPGQAQPTSAAADGRRISSGPRASLRLGHPKPSVRPGGAILPIAVTGPGRLLFSGRGLRIRIPPSRRFAHTPFSRLMPAAADLELELRAAGARLRRLRAGGGAKLAVTVRFDPAGGAATKTRTVAVALGI